MGMTMPKPKQRWTCEVTTPGGEVLTKDNLPSKYAAKKWARLYVAERVKVTRTY